MLRNLAVTFILFVCAISASDFDLPAIYQITEPVDHAEGPTWDSKRNMLFFVDIHAGGIYSFNFETKAVNHINLNGDVTPVIPCKTNQNMLVIGLNRSVATVEWDGTNELGQVKVLSTVAEEFPASRMNDGKADQKGRLWFGTMGAEDTNTGELVPNQGIFYKFEKGNLGNPTVEIAPVNISNGLAWNAANNKLYYIDTPTLQVAEYDYDNESGSISNRRTAFDLKDHPDVAGSPDGMTIDENDNLWVALYGGGSVIHVNPSTGELLQRIALPARDVTSTMWGGPNLDILFVTTSRVSLTEDQKKFYPDAGSVFAITNLKTKGRAVFDADVVDSV
ncbi:regucalcin-like [Anthonomus grandis grandis]|uniref:regucalcin-like n=1 Tax=Anthonomus grandis grandis TaxID=2921223 RepID=UPI00216602FA|nr:regucalcin-like [Anthonomus grandis grandis]